MSPNVGNFVHDLVEMAKAMETLPQVQADLDRANTAVENYAKQVQDREIAIIGYKEQIETLQSKVRATEAERDDAEMRFLEADDRMLKLERTFQRSLEAADEVDKLIQSFKPVPPQPEPVVEVQSQGSSEAPPTSTEHSATSGENVGQGNEASQPSASQGQGEGNPMTMGQTQTPVPAGSEQVTANPTDQTVSMDNPKPPGPYTGKRYYDHPTYINYWDWIDGGGTDADYHWRPGHDFGPAVGSSA